MNDINVIGIPRWPWKSPLLKYTKKHPKIVQINSLYLCYECSRHFELLNYFDEGKNQFAATEYYEYQKKNKKTKNSILARIESFQNLYTQIKREGCIVPPVITDDGCRLDGSHRCAILQHLQKPLIKVNVSRYEDIFSKSKSQKIREQVRRYRQGVYGLGEVK